MTLRRQSGSPDAAAFLREIASALPGLRVETVFDVGANTGQSLRRLEPAFPGAAIHAFEPSGAAFAKLSARFGDHPGVRLHPVALGAAAGRARMTARGTRTDNRLLAAGEAEAGASAGPSEMVEVVEGDAFCAAHGIATIELLKIDTEGHDLEALRGFAGMLARGAIALVQVEAALNPDNRKHVPLAAFSALLEPLGYRLFGIYDLVREFNGRPHLRRCNPAFVSPRAAEAARGAVAQ